MANRDLVIIDQVAGKRYEFYDGSDNKPKKRKLNGAKRRGQEIREALATVINRMSIDWEIPNVTVTFVERKRRRWCARYTCEGVREGDRGRFYEAETLSPFPGYEITVSSFLPPESAVALRNREQRTVSRRRRASRKTGYHGIGPLAVTHFNAHEAFSDGRRIRSVRNNLWPQGKITHNARSISDHKSIRKPHNNYTAINSLSRILRPRYQY